MNADVQRVNASVRSALEADLTWLIEVIIGSSSDEAVEWSGYMAKSAREWSQPKLATNYVFRPLIDSPPAHPDTVLTTLLYVEKAIRQNGGTYTHVVADMQLYKVALQIKWSDPERWKNLVLRLGGMQMMLMSFIGCIAIS